jgi:hypothetical protein
MMLLMGIIQKWLKITKFEQFPVILAIFLKKKGDTPWHAAFLTDHRQETYTRNLKPAWCHTADAGDFHAIILSWPGGIFQSASSEKSEFLLLFQPLHPTQADI